MSLSLNDVRRMKLPPTEVIALFSSLVSKAGAATQFVGGSIGFRVHGAEGGTWVLDLSVEGGRVLENATDAFDAATTRIYAYARDFAALIVAPDAIVGLLETGRIVVEGDKDKLGRLSKLIQRGRGQTSLALRAGG